MNGIHLITDTYHQNRFSHLDLAEAAFKAGVSYLQYREKNFMEDLHLAELLEIIKLGREYNTTIIINDYVEVALKVQASGLHLGKDDESPEIALQRIPRGFMIGATVHFLAEYYAIAHLPVNYIGVGPIFGTHSKTLNLPPLGLEGLRSICKISRFPVVAIGNIQVSDVTEILNQGATGVAVISAFSQTPDPYLAACEFQEAYLKAKNIVSVSCHS